MRARGNPSFSPYPFISPLPHLQLYILVSFTFYFFTRFIYFLAFPSLPILPEYTPTPFTGRML